MKKKYLIIILILIIILPLSIIFYPVIKNNNYQNDLINSVYDNTDIDNIVYLNKDNNYYIVKTSDQIIVLDLNYEEKTRVDISSIKESDMELVYRRNNLYYEEKIRESKSITYKYYDITTNELVYQTTIGGI